MIFFRHSAYLLFCLFLWSCRLKQSQGPSVTEIVPIGNGVFRGGVLRLNETEGIKSLHPAYVKEFAEYRAASQIYQGLVRLDPKDLSIQPCLAEAWSISENQLEYTFSIRKNVLFYSFGKTPQILTAQHVEACFKSIFSKPSPGHSKIAEHLILGASSFKTPSNSKVDGIGIYAIDKSTLKIKLKTPNNAFLYMLTNPTFWIYNEFMTDELMNMPAGTGPFYLQEQNEDYLLMGANEVYWEKDQMGEKLPYLTQVKVSFEKNKQKELNAFREGRLDMIYKLPLDQIDEAILELQEVIEQDGNIHYTAQSSPTVVTQLCGFNLRMDGMFHDVRVRRAFNLAIDRNALANYVLKGDVGVAIYGIIPPIYKDYDNGEVKGFLFDVEEARRLMKEAGYSNGQNVPEITLLTQQKSKKSKFVAYQVADMLRENLNIPIIVKEYPNDDDYLKARQEPNTIWQLSWFADYPDPENYLWLFTREYAQENAYFNYQNPTFDSIYQVGIKTRDKYEKQDALARAEQILIDDAVFIPLFYDEVTRLLNRRVKNLPINPMEYRDLSRTFVTREAKSFVYETPD